MGRLVQVHEVHVDLFVGDLPVVLGGKVAVGLLEAGKAVDPHLGGGEGVAPGDDTGAGIVVVGLLDHVGDLLVALGGDLVDQGIGQRLAQLIRHLRGPNGHCLQHILAIQGLTAYYEPKLHIFHDCLLLFQFKLSTAARSAGRAAT